MVSLSSNLYIGTEWLVSKTTLTLPLKPLHFDFSPNKVNVLANPMGLYVFKSNHNFIWMFTYMLFLCRVSQWDDTYKKTEQNGQD